MKGTYFFIASLLTAITVATFIPQPKPHQRVVGPAIIDQTEPFTTYTQYFNRFEPDTSAGVSP